METPNSLWQRALNDERGVTAIEYGLLAALIVIGCVVGIGATGVSLADLYVYWTDAVNAALQ